MTIRVVAADDQPLMVEAFRTILDAADGVELVGIASDGAAAIDLARERRPDVVLMDVRMPVLDGVTATRRIVDADPSVRVVMLTTFDLDEYIVEALRAGASGFLLKDATPAELLGAIRTVAAGDALLSPSVTRRLLDGVVRSMPSFQEARRARIASLTETELAVLTLVGDGLSNDEIARELLVSDSTVRTHLRHIQEKARLRDRIATLILAREMALSARRRPPATALSPSGD
jgi:DNA-binding NarL/FixJ family response regulator